MNDKNVVLAIILISYVMIVLDISIVLTGLPNIRRDLSFSDSGLSWVQNSYTLTFGGLMLLAARAGDILGRKRVLNVGLVIFSLSSVAVGASQTAEWMIATRAIQGIGAAILAPSTLALLQSTFAEGPERNRAISYYSAMSGISASIGLVLGGVLADLLSWRAGFFINLPIGVGLLALSVMHIKEPERQRGRFDIAGALVSTVGMTLLVYALIRTASDGWGDRLTLLLLAASMVLICVFVQIERKTPQPIMPLRLFASRERATAYTCRVLVIGAMIGFFFYTPQLLQNILGFRPALAGLSFLPTTLVNFCVAMNFQRLAAKFGNSPLLIVGLVTSLIGLLWLSQADPSSHYVFGVAVPMVFIGFGQGLMLGPLTASGLHGVKKEDAGAASGIISVAHQLGNSLGLAILIAVSALGLTKGDGVAELGAQVSRALEASSGLVCLALMLTVVLIIGPAGLTRGRSL